MSDCMFYHNRAGIIILMTYLFGSSFVVASIANVVDNSSDIQAGLPFSKSFVPVCHFSLADSALFPVESR